MEFLANVSEAVLWVCFLNVFCKSKRSRRYHIAGCAVAVLLLMINIEWSEQVAAYASYTVVVDLLIMFLYAAVFLEGKWYWQIFLILMFDLGLIISSFFTTNFFVTVLKIRPEEIFVEGGTYRIVFLICAKLVLLLELILVVRWKEKILAWKQLGGHVLALPVLAVSTVVLLMEVLNRFYKRTMDVVWVIWLVVLMSLLLFECARMAYEIYKGRKAAEMAEFMRKEILIQQETHRQQYENFRKIRKTQHDMKHKLIVIEQELLREQYGKAMDYTKSFLAELDEISDFRYGDSIVSTLLFIKEESARKYQIAMNIDLQITETERISEMDLCMILGNLLDNAIEAEKELLENREIRVFIRENEMLYISVENRIPDSGGKVTVRKGYTTHSNVQLHGFGIACIEEIVSQYRGNFELTKDNGWFRAEIMI